MGWVGWDSARIEETRVWVLRAGCEERELGWIRDRCDERRTMGNVVDRGVGMPRKEDRQRRTAQGGVLPGEGGGGGERRAIEDGDMTNADAVSVAGVSVDGTTRPG